MTEAVGEGRLWVAVAMNTRGVAVEGIADVGLGGGTVAVGGGIVKLGCAVGGGAGFMLPSASAKERPPTTSTTETSA